MTVADSPLHLNTVIARLQARMPVLGPWPIPAGDAYAAERIADSGFDVLILDMEHADFDLRVLRTTLQAMLSRAQIARDGLAPGVVPLVRIPPNGAEHNEWIVKQVLDLGAYGIVAPHLETVEEALAFVAASRYPDRRGTQPSRSASFKGLRGSGATAAARYWGLSMAEYVDHAGVWPLDEHGDILLVGMIESVRGIDNLDQICREAPGVGVIWVGTGDLAADMGLIGQRSHPEVQEQFSRALEICGANDVPCIALCDRADQADVRYQQGFRIVLMPAQMETPFPTERQRPSSSG